MKICSQIIVFLLFIVLLCSLPTFIKKDEINNENSSFEEECTAVIVTGTHAKDGRAIMMKNRDWSDTQYQKPWFVSSYAGGNYSYILMSAYMGMNEVGLAIMNTLQSCPGLNVWHYNIHGNYTNDKSVAMQYVLSHFSDVEKAVMWIVENTYGLCDCIGIIGQNSSVGAFVWIDGDKKYITWVNNSHDAAANSWVPNGVYGTRGARAKQLLDQIYNQKGYISWEDVIQEISKDEFDREKTNNNCYSYSDCISRGITRAAMVAVSGNSSYEGRLNIMWLTFGENPTIGLFLPLMPGVIDSSSDIPSIFTSGNGLGALVEVKRNYARNGCSSEQWNGTRVREIQSYSFYAENYTFKKYDELMKTIPSGLSYTQLKTLLKNYMNDSITVATNIYIAEKIPEDSLPNCSVLSIDESSPYAYALDNSIWYSNLSTGSFAVNIETNDDKGISKVSFPSTTSSGGDDTIPPYSWTYSWNTQSTYSGIATVTVYDTAQQTGTCIFSVIKDSVAPTTTVNIEGNYNIILSCEDSGVGCNVTYYCIDTDNSCNPSNVYLNPITTPCTGCCYLRYRSADKVNNVETVKSVSFGHTCGCSRGNPSVFIIPSSQSNLPGYKSTYIVSVKSNDNEACGISVFNLSLVCQAGISCSLINNTLAILPGNAVNTTLEITSSPSASEGNYIFTVRATNSLLSNYFGEASGSYIVVLKKLVLEYKFSEGLGLVAYDNSGFNNHANIFGANWIEGKHDFALSFDGIDDYLEVLQADSISGFSYGLSLSLWVKFNELNRRQAILNKYDTRSNQRGWFLEYQNHSTYRDVLGFFASYNGVNYSEWYTSFKPNLGEWYHLAVVWEPNKLPKFYVNGELKQTINNRTIPQIFNNTLAPFHIGKSTYATGREFNGTIDEIKIYNYALTDSEILEIFSNESKNYFKGFLTDKNGKPYQGIVSIDSRAGSIENGNYFLRIDSGNYDIIYSLVNFPVQGFWLKLLNYLIDSDLNNIVNYVDKQDNRISFVVECFNSQSVQAYSPSKPNKVKVNGVEIPYDDSLSSIPSWKYISSNKTIIIKFFCQ
ncbi:MAG: LamG-like jellyroll fold domain-containing protein [Candidatus Aenigmatarchaeota archaeon]